MDILGFDIPNALIPDVSIFETIVRGMLTYLFILIVIRYLMKGQTTSTMPSLIVIVLIADAAQNAMSASYSSLTNGAVLIATIVLTALVMNYLGQHFRFVSNLIHQERRRLIVDGQIVRKTLRQEFMTEEELMSQLRLQGVERLDEVKVSYLEGTGDISVLKWQPGDENRHRKTEPGA